MKIKYENEHLSCFQYQKSENNLIELVERKKGETITLFNDVNKVLFIIKGSVSVSFDKHVEEKISVNEFYFVPPKSHYSSTAKEDSLILLFRLNTNLDFCDHFSFQTLLGKKEEVTSSKEFTVLEANMALKNYLESMTKYIQDGLSCVSFYEIKIKELLFLLRAYYTKEELRAFFTAMLSADMEFSGKVYENCDTINSIQELAERMNYSLSGFKKRFKRVFGESASQWMRKRKARNIYHEINCTKKTFSEIGFEYGFSSASYFNDFCKANFGKTPGEIRNERLLLEE